MFELTPYRKNHLMHRAFDPFREMEEFERNFFDAPFFDENSFSQFKTDIKDEGDHFTLEADLPGFEKKDIGIDLDGDCMTIHAERHSEHEEKDKRGKYVRCERSYGSYSRSFDVSGINTDGVTAKYDNGVLSLTMPKKQPAEPTSKRLEIE